MHPGNRNTVKQILADAGSLLRKIRSRLCFQNYCPCWYFVLVVFSVLVLA